MKNSLFKKSAFDNDTLLSAVKRVNEKMGAVIHTTGQNSNNTGAQGIVPPKVKPSKYNQVERRLREMDEPVFGKNSDPAAGNGNEDKKSGETASNPGNKYDNYLTSRWNGDIPSVGNQADDIIPIYNDDSWKLHNQLNPSSGLVKNGSKTIGYTDAATNPKGPVRKYIGPNKLSYIGEPEKYEYLKQVQKEMNEYLASIGLDLGNQTKEQQTIVKKAIDEMGIKILYGNLNEGMKDTIIYETANKIATTTTNPNGGQYRITIAPDPDAPPKFQNKVLPMPGLVKTDGLPQYVVDAIRANGIDQDTKNLVIQATIAYNEARRKAGDQAVDFVKYYEKMSMEIYEKILRPVTYTKVNEAGKTITVNGMIRDFISPTDNSFGAQFAREVLRLTGLARLEKAGTLVPGENGDYEIDCARLVCWGISQMDPKWKVDTISTAARYQIDDFPVVWPTKENDTLDYTELKPGDTLFWQGVESGEIVHTAIYLGNGMMIETMNTVQIVKVREYTHGGDREDSQLVQINRMTPEGLDAEHEQNTKG